jgi:hypothetical protein
MFTPPVNLGDASHAIQLALTPVFLLTGIAGMLNVMTGRLSRIIDRARLLTEWRPPATPPTGVELQAELQNLERRRQLTSVAINACTLAALLVCLVVVALFLEVLVWVELRWLAGTLFTAAILALVVGLAYFLREVHLATRLIRFPH